MTAPGIASGAAPAPNRSPARQRHGTTKRPAHRPRPASRAACSASTYREPSRGYASACPCHQPGVQVFAPRVAPPQHRILWIAPAVEAAQLRRLKELEKENERLRRAVSDLTLDKQILAEAARGNL